MQAAEKLANRETMLQEANQALESSRGDLEELRCRLERARTREREVVGAVEEERQAALEKIAELESLIERSEREHGLLRERTEGRLELLRSAMEEEEQENAPQVCVGAWVSFPQARVTSWSLPPFQLMNGAATKSYVRQFALRSAPPPRPSATR